MEELSGNPSVWLALACRLAALSLSIVGGLLASVRALAVRPREVLGS